MKTRAGVFRVNRWFLCFEFEYKGERKRDACHIIWALNVSDFKMPK